MAFPAASHRTSTSQRHRRLVPVAVIVLVYVLGGTLWILGGGPVGDGVAEATSVPRWVIEIFKGLLFVAITALALQLVLRRRADQLDTADARTDVEAHRLHASEGRNRVQTTALSGTANAVIITDRDGTIEWVNPAFETMSGYPSSVAIGSTPRLTGSGLQDEEFYAELWDTILGGQVWRGQVVNRRRDGGPYTVRQTITPVVDESGEVEHFVAIQEDISQRVRAAHDLEASRLQLQSLFDNALDAIILADDEGRYLEVNPAVCELTGYSRDELVGMRPADLAAADQPPADVAGQFNAFLRAGTEAGTFALRHKEGHLVETEYRAVSNIQPGVHLSVLRDVTHRNTMLRALTLAEGQFRQLAENAADIVAKLQIDQDGQLVIDYINPAATTILGYPPERFYDDPDLLLMDLFHQRGDDLDEALDLLPTPAEPTRLATVQIQAADGRLVWLEVHSALTDMSTTPVTIQLVGRDVTARLEMTEALEQALDHQLESAEQLRALNAMKDTFLQSVSHELRTPLTSILGFATLLADPSRGLSPEHTREFHRRIVSNAERLQRLLDDLLDVDRFTSGQIKANRLPTDLSELVERVAHDIDVGDHPLALDLEPIAMGLDTPWVERIIANLLHNILRHTPPDTRIWIRTRATSDGVELTVDDDGPGIPQADFQRVIEPFEQGTRSASSAQPGTGVGLSLVNAFAKIHGGGLAITDSPTGGVRATVTLAHAEAESGPALVLGEGHPSGAATSAVAGKVDVREAEPVDGVTEVGPNGRQTPRLVADAHHVPGQVRSALPDRSMPSGFEELGGLGTLLDDLTAGDGLLQVSFRPVPGADVDRAAVHGTIAAALTRENVRAMDRTFLLEPLRFLVVLPQCGKRSLPAVHRRLADATARSLPALDLHVMTAMADGAGGAAAFRTFQQQLVA